jgi:hypothetical protein
MPIVLEMLHLHLVLVVVLMHRQLVRMQRLLVEQLLLVLCTNRYLGSHDHPPYHPPLRGTNCLRSSRLAILSDPGPHFINLLRDESSNQSQLLLSSRDAARSLRRIFLAGAGITAVSGASDAGNSGSRGPCDQTAAAGAAAVTTDCASTRSSVTASAGA